MTDAPIRVVVADDHAIVRAGLRQVLALPAFDVLDAVGTAADAVAAVVARDPDVLVLDVTMPGGSGLSVVETLRARAPRTRILVLSVHDEAEYVLESVRLGAHGYARKDSGPTELRAAVRAVHDGNAYFSPAVARHLSAALRDQVPAAPTEVAGALDPQAIASLTAREREVLAHVARGGTSKQVAAALGISPRTVEAHRESVMRKLGVRSVAGLTRIAIEAGLATE